VPYVSADLGEARAQLPASREYRTSPKLLCSLD
jgi:hypothetical protein